jgi:hypothetical protein
MTGVPEWPVLDEPASGPCRWGRTATETGAVTTVVAPCSFSTGEVLDVVDVEDSS